MRISRWLFGSVIIYASMDAENTLNLPLPEAFLNFLNENGVSPSIYTVSNSIPRYIRYYNDYS